MFLKTLVSMLQAVCRIFIHILCAIGYDALHFCILQLEILHLAVCFCLKKNKNKKQTYKKRRGLLFLCALLSSCGEWRESPHQIFSVCAKTARFGLLSFSRPLLLWPVGRQLRWNLTFRWYILRNFSWSCASSSCIIAPFDAFLFFLLRCVEGRQPVMIF